MNMNSEHVHEHVAVGLQRGSTDLLVLHGIILFLAQSIDTVLRSDNAVVVDHLADNKVSALGLLMKSWSTSRRP